MSDRVPSDHDAVDTHRVAIEAVGRTGRPRVVLPEDTGLTDGDVATFALDGDDYEARVETSLDGDFVVTHVADNRRLARERDGENRLAEWVASGDVVHRETVVDGLSNAPDAFLGLFSGDNVGKQVVSVSSS